MAAGQSHKRTPEASEDSPRFRFPAVRVRLFRRRHARKVREAASPATVTGNLPSRIADFRAFFPMRLYLNLVQLCDMTRNAFFSRLRLHTATPYSYRSIQYGTIRRRI